MIYICWQSAHESVAPPPFTDGDDYILLRWAAEDEWPLAPVEVIVRRLKLLPRAPIVVVSPADELVPGRESMVFAALMKLGRSADLAELLVVH